MQYDALDAEQMQRLSQMMNRTDLKAKLKHLNEKREIPKRLPLTRDNSVQLSTTNPNAIYR